MPSGILFDRPGREQHDLTVDGWVGGKLQQVSCRRNPDGYLLVIAELGRFHIDASGSEIVVLHNGAENEPPSPEVLEVVFGLAIALALALQEVWCFQSSMVQCTGVAVAFLGGTGVGKSTLARELHKEGWAERFIVDDVLPVDIRDGQFDCLPHFPQLDLSTDEQFGQGNRDRIPMGKFCVLDVRKAKDNSRATVRPLPAQQAIEALVTHTVGAELFGPALVDRHRIFCSRVVEQTEVLNIQYPLRSESIGRVGEMIQYFVAN